MNTLDFNQYEITGPTILTNLSTAALYEEAIRYDRGTCISSTGALVTYFGSKTGRSPKDKRIVKEALSENDIWWGPVNFPLDELSFKINRQEPATIFPAVSGSTSWMAAPAGIRNIVSRFE